MLSWLAMFVGANLGIQSKMEQCQETKGTRPPKEVPDKEMARDLARADDDGFAINQN